MAGKKQNDPVEIDFRSDEMTLSDAISTGTRLDELKAIRRLIVSHMENPETLARDLAALTRQMREISKEIETLEVQESDAKRDLDDEDAQPSHHGEAWNLKAI